MNEYGGHPSPFIEGTTLQFAYDNTSLAALKKCPRYYQFSIILGWQPLGQSVHLRFGIIFHAALELYDKAHAADPSLTHDDLVDRCVDYVLTATWDRTEQISPESGEVTESGEPWASGHSAKTRETLVRSVIWYLEEYKDDVAKTLILANGAPAVELSFKLALDQLAPNGSPYLLAGHLDRVVDFGGNVFVMDRKTTGSTLSAYYFRQYSPDGQMSQYTFASKVLLSGPVQGVIIDAAQVAVGFTRFERGITARSDAQLEEWHDNTLYWISLAERYAADGYYPMNESSCGNYGGCSFREVCSQNPRVREHYLRTGFEKRFWNPLQAR